MSTHELHLFILCAVQDDSGFYKNALQELAQREDLSMPVYKIIKSGALHMPTFFSYVEIEGEKFYGKAGKSKKEAELKSARAAYTVLMERKSIHSFYEAAYTILGTKNFGLLVNFTSIYEHMAGR
jgi:hypothetical protein